MISKFCESYGFEPIIYELDNERSIEIKNINKIRMQPSFENSIKIIKNSCAVISCDSLPVHLSAYIGRPVFVMSPYAKTNYWLPENSFQNQYWNLFENIDELFNSLINFLLGIKNSRIDHIN
jgi:ADP-heptose:LPS heptosyltransferase